MNGPIIGQVKETIQQEQNGISEETQRLDGLINTLEEVSAELTKRLQAITKQIPEAQRDSSQKLQRARSDYANYLSGMNDRIVTALEKLQLILEKIDL